MFTPIRTSDARAAFTTFAASAATFDAPVPRALLRIAQRATLAVTVEGIRDLLDEALALAAGGQDAASLSPIQCRSRGELAHTAVNVYGEDLGSEFVCRLSFGTGRSRAFMDVYQCGQDVWFSLWAEATLAGCADPREFESLARSLERRWQQLRAVPTAQTEAAEIIRRATEEGDDRVAAA